ncbi:MULTISPECIES: DUF4250 domain-containing protein [unclassified Butyrivibrio]|uniref:DUF4250 domain-containing protein n=1 Tax=unclassified Butyrivibrio TaxID=2639466 RepID=UPI000423265F|nr:MULTISPECIES: DUF4250 domain-containing protein [unclassified Butyrivibrio]
MIPKDPVILLSYINTQLRDNYNSLEDLAEGLSLGEEEISSIIAKLEGIGYNYSSDANQFV